MPTIKYEGLEIEVDQDGYLVNFEDWNDQVACALADQEGISHQCPMSEERMEILRFMRNYYTTHNSFPVVRALCKNVHQDAACTYEQFPDPIKAWKIAGLPKPSTEVFARVKHEAWPHH